MSRLPKPIYPWRLDEHALYMGEYVRVRNNKGTQLVYPCPTKDIRTYVLKRLAFAKNLEVIPAYYTDDQVIKLLERKAKEVE